jgi:O-antigen ligase
LICCSWLALDTIKTFLAGGFYHPLGGVGRNEGPASGLFSNPNDRAIIFSMLLPLAVALGLIRRSLVGLLFLGLASLFAVGVIASHSRAGLLSSIATAAFLIWKFGRRKRWVIWVAGALLIAFIALATMGSLGERFFNPNKDKLESAEERKKVLKRAAVLSLRHSVIGLGIGNFHIYSFRELKAHNAYLEIAAELGFIGLLAYLIMLITPIRSLIRIERRPYDLKEKSAREIYYLSIGLQGTFLAYLICSFFGSIQYSWFIYHPIVFAIALRRITQFEAQSAAESFDTKLAGGTAPEQGQIRWRGTLWRPHRVGRLLQTGVVTQFEAQSAAESFDTKRAVGTVPEQCQIRGTLWRPHCVGRLFQTGASNTGATIALRRSGKRWVNG